MTESFCQEPKHPSVGPPLCTPTSNAAVEITDEHFSMAQRITKIDKGDPSAASFTGSMPVWSGDFEIEERQYLDEVKRELENDAKAYTEFLETIKKFKMCAIGVSEVSSLELSAKLHTLFTFL